MKIKIGYDSKSIDKAIKQIEEYRKHLVKLFPKFLERCADKIIELANNHLDDSANGIDVSILSLVKAGWQKQQPIQTEKSCSIIIENITDKATYLEFGVGQVGAENQPKLASEVGYEYNLPSKYKEYDEKSGKMVWWFRPKSSGVDIAPQYQLETSGNTSGIKTAGQPAMMYVFNAVQDFMDKEMYKPIWEELIKGL